MLDWEYTEARQEVVKKGIQRAKLRIKIRECQGCNLFKNFHGPVPFDGPNPNNVVVIGEAPGAMEDRICQPFVGPSGSLARQWIDDNTTLDTPTYMNVVSCYPNRTPTQAEVDACYSNVEEQLNLIQPKYALVFGGVATNALLRLRAKLQEIRGHWWRIEGKWGGCWALTTYHPAAILRNHNLEHKTVEDIILFGLVACKGNVPVLSDKCIKCSKGVYLRHRSVPLCRDHRVRYPKVGYQEQLFETPNNEYSQRKGRKHG